MKVKTGQLIGSIALCMLVAFAGSTFTPAKGSEWYYVILNKPAWNPPDWLFPPVWTVLFVLMGIALAMVIHDGFRRPGVKGAVTVFAVQLLLNLGWSAAFFGMQSPLLGFGVILLLWAAIVLTIIRFRAISAAAAWLLAPYLLWVSFASYLNFTIVQMNP